MYYNRYSGNQLILIYAESSGENDTKTDVTSLITLYYIDLLFDTFESGDIFFYTGGVTYNQIYFKYNNEFYKLFFGNFDKDEDENYFFIEVPISEEDTLQLKINIPVLASIGYENYAGSVVYPIVGDYQWNDSIYQFTKLKYTSDEGFYYYFILKLVGNFEGADSLFECLQTLGDSSLDVWNIDSETMEIIKIADVKYSLYDDCIEFTLNDQEFKFFNSNIECSNPRLYLPFISNEEDWVGIDLYSTAQSPGEEPLQYFKYVKDTEVDDENVEVYINSQWVNDNYKNISINAALSGVDEDGNDNPTDYLFYNFILEQNLEQSLSLNLNNIYKWNEAINISNNIEQSFNSPLPYYINSDDEKKEISKIIINYANDQDITIYYDEIEVYKNSTWVDNSYKTISYGISNKLISMSYYDLIINNSSPLNGVIVDLNSLENWGDLNEGEEYNLKVISTASGYDPSSGIITQFIKE